MSKNRWIDGIKSVLRPPVNRVLVVYGMKRSGNHAIVNWIIEQGSFRFINNLVPISPILEGRESIPPPRDFTNWARTRGLRPTRTPRPRHQALIVSLEDHDLNMIPFRDVPCELKNLLILRDPSNLFASRIRKATREPNSTSFPSTSGGVMDRAAGVWKSHAQEFLGLTHQLENLLPVYFDAWFSDQTYRKHISESLNLKFCDTGFSRVTTFGGGSSFDDGNFDGRSGEMGVLSRHEQLTESERQLLDRVFEDDELRILSDRVKRTRSHANLGRPE